MNNTLIRRGSRRSLCGFAHRQWHFPLWSATPQCPSRPKLQCSPSADERHQFHLVAVPEYLVVLFRFQEPAVEFDGDFAFLKLIAGDQGADGFTFRKVAGVAVHGHVHMRSVGRALPAGHADDGLATKNDRAVVGCLPPSARNVPGSPNDKEVASSRTARRFHDLRLRDSGWLPNLPLSDYRWGMITNMTPRQLVAELDKWIVGQIEAKRAVAVAIRNRWRRLQLTPELKDSVTGKNILIFFPVGNCRVLSEDDAKNPDNLVSPI